MLPGTRTRPAAASVTPGGHQAPACLVLHSSTMEVCAWLKSLQRVPESHYLLQADHVLHPAVRSSLVVGVEVVEVVEEVEEVAVQETLEVMSVFSLCFN